VEDLRARLAETRERYGQALVELELHRPESAALVSVDAATLAEVQAEVLEPKTTLVAFYVLDAHVLAWVIDRETVRMVTLEIDRQTLERKIRELEDSIVSRDFDRHTASLLYHRLIAPLRAHIRHRQLIVVPHGALHQLPFAALWDAREERYLIEEASLIYAPSASVLRFLKPKRSPNEGRLLILGNPDGSLPQAEEETRSIARLYGGVTPLLGAEATEGRLRAAAGTFDILHLAAHARWNPQQPQFTRLELAPGDGHDGHLEVREIFGELDFHGVNLVVLSACNTARGERTRGDEILGLTRAFLYAGSSAVITTFWQIDDRASRFLMEAFHRRLRAGESAAEALRLAQLATREQPQWSSPYYWAPFALHGDRSSVERPAQSIRSTRTSVPGGR
jgi:CHAT domain-containing protein